MTADPGEMAPQGATVIPLNRAERRRREREAERSEREATRAAKEAEREARLDINDVRTVLLGAGAWSVGHPTFPPGEARDIFRGACDRVAAFLDMELGWPEDPPASGLALPSRPSGLIIP